MQFNSVDDQLLLLGFSFVAAFHITDLFEVVRAQLESRRNIIDAEEKI